MPSPFPEPTEPRGSRSEVFASYLDFFRERAIERVHEMPPGSATSSRLPSRWTPLQLLHHLRHAERRWIVWGFLGEPLDDPWQDEDDGRWQVPDQLGLDDVVDQLREQGVRTRAVLESHPLDTHGRPGPRWAGSSPATLERVLFHLLQEYARHLGHLDIVSELAGGGSGE